MLSDGVVGLAGAERLGLSAKTVANHISAIFAKLQVADRTQAILRARDAGLGHP
jgi:DNA-binding NarL/FixJ family response regulator